MALRRTLIALIWTIFVGVGVGHPESQVIGGKWGGLNNSDSSIFIDDNEAQDLLNVDISDSGYGIKKRAGYAQYKTLTVSTSGVTGSHLFTDASSSVELIMAHDVYVSKSVAGGAFTNFVTTATRGAFWDFADFNGTLYGLNSSNDELWGYDGTTLTYYPSAPKGKFIEILPDRMAIAGTTANPNQVSFSGAADFTTFTTGPEITDPFTETFGLPGETITAMLYANGRLLIWTESTLSFWFGEDQYNAVIQDISSTIGTIQPLSVVYENGIVYFQGTDNNFYAYDFSQLVEVSEKIHDSTDGMPDIGQNSWEVDTQAEWGMGASFGAGLSSTTNSGDLVWSPNVLIGDDNELASNPLSAGQSIVPGVTCDAAFIATQLTLKLWNTSASAYADNLTITLRQGSSTSPTNGTIVSTAIITAATLSAVTQYSIARATASFSPSVSLSLGTTYWWYIDSIPTGMYLRGASGNPNSTSQGWVGTKASTIDHYFALSNSTVTYQSEHHNIGTGITAWGAFNAVNATPPGSSVAYALYIDSETAIDITNATTFVSSEAVSWGGIPTGAVNQYGTLTVTFTRNAATAAMSVSQMEQSWFESPTHRNYGFVDEDHRLWWSVLEGTGTSNNAAYIFDWRFASWLKYDTPVSAPVQYGPKTYFGGPSTGVVYVFPSGNDDDGSAINAFFKSKDFVSGDPFVDKLFRQYSIVAEPKSGSSFDLTYTIDRSSVVTISDISLTEPNNLSVYRRNAFFPIGTRGSFINFKFGNNAKDAPFEFNLLKYDYEPNPWRPYP